MKYMKISSLLVLSLLLFVPSAWADLECNLQSESHDLRAESMHEALDSLEVLCAWDANDFAAGGGTAIPMFDLELILSADLSNQDDMMPYLEFTGAVTPSSGTTPSATKVNPADVGSDDIEWEKVRLPIAGAFSSGATTATNLATSWDPGSDWDDGSAASASFWIKGIYIDATEAGDQVRASLRMTNVANALATGVTFKSDRDRVDIADVDPGIEELVFTPKAKMGKPGAPNACNPVKYMIEVDVEEGFRGAWGVGNDIVLSLSSGSMKDVSAAGPLEVDTRSSEADVLIYEVTDSGSRQTASLKIEITPVVGEKDDEITLSAEFDPRRGMDEEFVVSDTLVVGTYGACEGDRLLFPFLSNMSGFDSGVALINNSDGKGECVLSWDGKVEEDYADVQERDKMDVDAKSQTVFILSTANPGFQGLLSVQCEFGAAYGYAFITDSAGSGAQGYVAR